MKKCYGCGFPVNSNQPYCQVCGMPVPPPSPVAEFFLACLKSLGYFALFFGIQYCFVLLCSLVVGLSVRSAYPYGSDTAGLANMINSEISKYIHVFLITSAIITLLTLFLIARINGKTFKDSVRLNPVSPSVMGSAFVLGCMAQTFFSLAILLVMSIIPNGDRVLREFAEGSDMLSGGNIIIEIISVAVVTPVVEEIVFRGFIQRTLRKALPVAPAVILSSVIFGITHGHIISAIYASCLGIIMALLYEKYDSISVCILIHAGFNGFSYILQLVEFDMILLTGTLLISLGIAIIFAVSLFCNQSDGIDSLRLILRKTNKTYNNANTNEVNYEAL